MSEVASALQFRHGVFHGAQKHSGIVVTNQL